MRESKIGNEWRKTKELFKNLKLFLNPKDRKNERKRETKKKILSQYDMTKMALYPASVLSPPENHNPTLIMRKI